MLKGYFGYIDFWQVVVTVLLPGLSVGIKYHKRVSVVKNELLIVDAANVEFSLYLALCL